jgi:hypothetical protein
MTASHSQIIAFDVTTFLSILLLILAWVPPIFSRIARRRKTWHTFMLPMLVFSTGRILLVGRQSGDPPNPTLCLIQAAVNYATAPL